MDKQAWKEFIRDYLNYSADDDLPAVADYVAEQLEKEQIVPGNVQSESLGSISVTYMQDSIPPKYLNMLKTYRRLGWT